MIFNCALDFTYLWRRRGSKTLADLSSLAQHRVLEIEGPEDVAEAVLRPDH